jgi:hypothetical protein
MEDSEAGDLEDEFYKQAINTRYLIKLLVPLTLQVAKIVLY